MNTPTRDDLLGFVLGALEAEEHQRVADCLQARPDLQLELQRIQALFAPLECCRQPPGDFPVGLARRTCEIVSRESRHAAHPQDAESSARSSGPALEKSSATSTTIPLQRRRMPESAVLVCCAALLGAALGPAAMRLTQAVSKSPVSLGAIAAHRSESTGPTFIAATKSMSNLHAMDIRDSREGNAFSIALCEDQFGSPPWRIALPPETRPIGAKNACAATDLPLTLISFCAQSSGAFPAGESTPGITDVGGWNDWRPLAGDWPAENRGSANQNSAIRIGQAPAFRLFSSYLFESEVQPLSN